ncbi:hypothetical protein PRBEI_2000322200 [Prionailurus iriomotensis]
MFSGLRSCVRVCGEHVVFGAKKPNVPIKATPSFPAGWECTLVVEDVKKRPPCMEPHTLLFKGPHEFFHMGELPTIL